LKRLECAAFRTADEVGGVNDAIVIASCELERIESAVQSIQCECDALCTRKGNLLAEISGLQADLREAKDDIDEGRDRRSLCKAELHMIDKAREEGAKIWKQIEMFKSGGLAAEFNKKMHRYNELEKEIDSMEEQLADVHMEDRDKI